MDDDNFVWDDVIAEDVVGRYIVTEESLRKAIERYGVDTRDYYRGSIFTSILQNYLLEKDRKRLIDIIFEYHPRPLMVRGHIMADYLSNNSYILQKFLEHDTDYKINRYPCILGINATYYDNLLTIMLKMNKKSAGVYNKQVELLSNHMIRGTTFFELMKERLL